MKIEISDNALVLRLGLAALLVGGLLLGCLVTYERLAERAPATRETSK